MQDPNQTMRSRFPTLNSIKLDHWDNGCGSSNAEFDILSELVKKDKSNKTNSSRRPILTGLPSINLDINQDENNASPQLKQEKKGVFHEIKRDKFKRNLSKIKVNETPESSSEKQQSPPTQQESPSTEGVTIKKTISTPPDSNKSSYQFGQDLQHSPAFKPSMRTGTKTTSQLFKLGVEKTTDKKKTLPSPQISTQASESESDSPGLSKVVAHGRKSYQSTPVKVDHSIFFQTRPNPPTEVESKESLQQLSNPLDDAVLIRDEAGTQTFSPQDSVDMLLNSSQLATPRRTPRLSLERIAAMTELRSNELPQSPANRKYAASPKHLLNDVSLSGQATPTASGRLSGKKPMLGLPLTQNSPTYQNPLLKYTSKGQDFTSFTQSLLAHDNTESTQIEISRISMCRSPTHSRKNSYNPAQHSIFQQLAIAQLTMSSSVFTSIDQQLLQ